mgnify:FL=1
MLEVQEMYLMDCEERMEKSVNAFDSLLRTVRTGRASVSMLDPVSVDYYGSPTPLNQIASMSVLEGKQIVIKPYDPSSLKNIEKAIYAANLNLTPQNDGTIIRINVPMMTEETRRQTVKDLGKSLEEAKVSVRNIRRDINDSIKKDKDLTEDFEKDTLEQVQKLTDESIKKLEALHKAKAEEIMKI